MQAQRGKNLCQLSQVLSLEVVLSQLMHQDQDQHWNQPLNRQTSDLLDLLILKLNKTSFKLVDWDQILTTSMESDHHHSYTAKNQAMLLFQRIQMSLRD